jgi:hypothetical protein
LNEFNSLANLIGSSGDTSLDFKLNLFSDSAPIDAEGGASINSQQDNIINIDLGKQGQNDKVKSVMNQLGNVDLSAA